MDVFIQYALQHCAVDNDVLVKHPHILQLVHVTGTTHVRKC